MQKIAPIPAQAEILAAMSDGELLEDYHWALEAAERARRNAGLREQEIMRRMRDRGAAGIPDAAYDCRITTTTNYDRTRFAPLKEILQPDDLAACYTPEHQETISVAEKWDLRKLVPQAKRYGREALNVLGDAEIEPTVKLTFKRNQEAENRGST